MVKRTIITPAFKAETTTQICIESVKKYTPHCQHIIVAQECDLSHFNKYDITIVNSPKNEGVSRAWNKGMLIAQGSVWYMMANDVEVKEDWYKKFEAPFKHKNIAAVFCDDMSVHAYDPEWIKRWGGFDEHLFFTEEDVEMQQRVWYSGIPNPILDKWPRHTIKVLKRIPFIHRQHASSQVFTPAERSAFLKQGMEWRGRKYDGLGNTV